MAGGGMGRVLGLGFLFGAKDDGAIRMTEDIGEGMENMATSVREAGEESAGIQRLGNFINALNLSQLTRVSGALEGLADRAGALSGEISSTSMESHGAQFAQEYRQATAGMGEYRAEVDAVRGEISGLSFELGVSGTDMISYAAAVARTGNSVEDFGIDMRQVAGSIQAGILSGEQLASVMTNLSESYGLGGEGALRVVDTVSALGTQFGVGAEAARALPEVLTAVDAAAARFPSIGENVDVAVESITRLGLAQQRALGGSLQDNMQGAITVFNELAGSRREMESMITGLGGEFPELAAEIARATGDTGMSLEAIMQDPVRFASTMQEMFANMGPQSVAAARLRASLESMGPAFNFLVQGGEESREALQAAMVDAGDVEGAFGDMAGAVAGSSRTFAERMELVEERFRAGLDRMASRHYPGFEAAVIDRQRNAYNMLTNTVNDFAGGRGAMGLLTRSMLSFRRGGFQGLMVAMEREAGRNGSFSRLRGWVDNLVPGVGTELAGAFNNLKDRVRGAAPWLDMFGEGVFEIAGQALPAATGLGAMGLKFRHIASGLRLVARSLGPFVLLVGLGVGIYHLSRNLDRVQDSLMNAANGFRDFGQFVQRIANMIDWEQFGTDLVDGIIGAFQSLAGAGEGAQMSATATAIAEGFSALFDGVARIVGGLARGMWTRIVEWILEPPDIESQVNRAGAAAGVTVGATFGAAMLTPLRGGILRALGRLFSGFGAIFTGPGRGLAGTAMRTLLRRIPYIGAVIGVLFDLPEIITSFRTEGIISGFRTLFSSIVNGLLFGIPSLLEGWTGTDITGSIFDFLMDMFNIESIVEYFRSGQILRGIVEAIYSLPGTGLVRMLMEHLIGEDTVTEYLDGVTDMLRTWGGILQDTFNQWLGYVTPLFDEWMDVFSEVGGVLGELWNDTLAPLLEDIFGFSFDVEGVGDMFGNAEEGAQGFGDMIRRVMDWLMPKIQWLHRTAMPLVVQGVRDWADRIRTVVAVVRWLWRVGRRVYPHIRNAIENVIEGFRVWMAVVTFLWRRVVKPVFRFIWRLFQRVFIRGILPAALRVFRAIGRVVTWLWERVVRPIFGFLWRFWSQVMTNVWNAARRVFTIISRFITEKIRQAASAFRILAAAWEVTKTVLATGFRLIAAEVNRYIIVPFLRVRNTMSSLAETMTVAFLRVKQTLVGLFRELLQGIQSFLQSIPGIGSTIAGRLTTPIEDISTTIDEIGNEITAVERRGSEFRRQNEQTISEANTRSDEAREALAEAEAQRQVAVRDAAMEEAQRRASLRAGDRAMEQAAEGGPTRAAAEPAGEVPVAVPSAPSLEEGEREARSAATRREGAIEDESTREAREIAEEMMISGFSGQAKRDMTDAMRAAMPPIPPGQRTRVEGTPPTGDSPYQDR